LVLLVQLDQRHLFVLVVLEVPAIQVDQMDLGSLWFLLFQGYQMDQTDLSVLEVRQVLMAQFLL
jgi:hypothetical protein